MYCKTCRQPLPHDARRCPNCGAPVENTVLQSGARDFTADYDPRDIQENRGWGILSYFGFLVLIPIFAARNSYFARFHANQGLVLFLFQLASHFGTFIIIGRLNLHHFISLYDLQLLLYTDVNQHIDKLLCPQSS